MIARVAKARPDARLQGFTVQPMIVRPNAHELLLGVFEDRLFGPMILFGAGGTATEVIKDTAVALPPLDIKLARDLMQQTRISRLLQGYRDRPAADLDAIADTLVRLSQLVMDCPALRELDINPLLADENGVVALDARIRIEGNELDEPAPNPRLAIRPYPNQLGETSRNAKRQARPDQADQACGRAGSCRVSDQAHAGGHPLPLPRPAQGVLPQVRSPASRRSTMPAPWPSSRSARTRASCSAWRGSRPTRTI